MAKEMTKRERVERTLAFQETDRIPIYDLLRCDAAFEHFAGERLPTLSEDPQTAKTLHRIACKAVGNFLDMTRSVGFGPLAEKDTTDTYGFMHHHAPFLKTSWIVKRPFEDEQGAMAFIEKWTDAVKKRTREIQSDQVHFREKVHRDFLERRSNMSDTVELLAEQGTGLDSLRHALGMELFTYVYLDSPNLLGEAMDAETDQNVAICHAIADPKLSPVVLTYGDIACKDRLLHSPAFLRKEFLPRIKRIHDAWHEHHIKCLFHSDGNLMEIMDDLIEAEIDGLNPIETVAGMDLKTLREAYGNKIFLAGGIDMSQLLSRGTPDQVREVCRQAIRDAYPGFFMGSTTEADNSCRLENLIAMREVALETP